MNLGDGKTSKRKKRSVWNSSSESILIDIWEEKASQLRGCRKNLHILKEMTKVLEQCGHTFSPDEIKSKIHNMSAKYRSERKKVGSTGGSPSQWIHYNKLHQILGSYKTYNIGDIVEESIIEYDDPDDPDLSVGAARLCSTPVPLELPYEMLEESSSDEPAKKRKPNMLEEIKKGNEWLRSTIEKLNETERTAVAIEDRYIEIEERKCAILEKILDKLN